jgi:hypothetical protein
MLADVERHRRDSSRAGAQNEPMRHITGDPATDRYLADLVATADGILGDRLVGAYALNSVARGNYLPGRSDLDVAIVVSEPLDPPTRQRLAEATRHASLPCPAPRLELVVYPRAVVADPGPAPAFELNLNTGPAIADHLTTDPADEPSHWFVLDLAAAADVALALHGPAPTELFGPVARPVVLDALRASWAWHAAHDAAAPNRVLNDCRAWRFVAEDRWSTKAEAGAWAIAAGGDADLIRHALALREGDRDDPLDPRRVRRFADRVGDVLASTITPEGRTGRRPAPP